MAQMAREKDGGRAPTVRDVNIEQFLLIVLQNKVILNMVTTI